ncbi:RNA-directed DNA polymerase, partial [Acinetobacter baumannii]|uniref:RNA-directed DNA polymerase n=1 Tax=Acinetobacter baumannii TaxID=470 RepID=UPI00339A6391
MVAIKTLKNGKTAGPDGIPAEALKVDPNMTADFLHPLLQKIMDTECVPADWKTGYLVKLPEKGDLSECSNWRGIVLLSIPSKVLTRIILNRLRDALDTRLRAEQAGFRRNSSCADYIAFLHIIIEQSMELQSLLIMTFVDFEKAFDSVDRETNWKLLLHYGIPVKYVHLIKQLYKSSSCQVVHNRKLSDPFTVKTGVRQGCLLS